MKHCPATSEWQTPCVLPEGGHLDHLDESNRMWSNTEVIRPHSRHEAGHPLAKARQMAAGARRHTTALYAPLGREKAVLDPPEPGNDTAKARVLAYLSEREGRWVPGWELVGLAVGGLNGTRRARELRQEGHTIDIEPHPARAREWRYRYRKETS
jgi:hypothetical protein